VAFGAAKTTSCSTLDSCNSVGILSMEKSKRKCNPLEDFYAEIFRARYKTCVFDGKKDRGCCYFKHKYLFKKQIIDVFTKDFFFQS
jgi:hypothetical protein